MSHVGNFAFASLTRRCVNANHHDTGAQLWQMLLLFQLQYEYPSFQRKLFFPDPPSTSQIVNRYWILIAHWKWLPLLDVPINRYSCNVPIVKAKTTIEARLPDSTTRHLLASNRLGSNNLNVKKNNPVFGLIFFAKVLWNLIWPRPSWCAVWASMDSQQRTSALQQRLQARREMFMKENSLVGGVAAANGTSPPATAAPYTVGKLSVGSAPASAPPQPPPTAPRGGVQGALASLREKNNTTITNVLLSFL